MSKTKKIRHKLKQIQTQNRNLIKKYPWLAAKDYKTGRPLIRKDGRERYIVTEFQ